MTDSRARLHPRRGSKNNRERRHKEVFCASQDTFVWHVEGNTRTNNMRRSSRWVPNFHVGGNQLLSLRTQHPSIIVVA